LIRYDPAPRAVAVPADRGTLTFTELFVQPSGYRFTCASGPVAFTWPR
jgi:hypothetical protein